MITASSGTVTVMPSTGAAECLTLI
jgi:hypothetical protein